MRKAQTQIGYTKVTAPFDGVVTRRTVDTGAVVGPAKPGETAPLLTVMRDDVVHVAFDVDERQRLAGRRRPAGRDPRAAALGETEFQGKVTRISGAIDPAAGTFRVEIDLPNPDGKLRPGMFVNVELKKDGAGK